MASDFAITTGSAINGNIPIAIIAAIRKHFFPKPENNVLVGAALRDNCTLGIKSHIAVQMNGIGNIIISRRNDHFTGRHICSTLPHKFQNKVQHIGDISSILDIQGNLCGICRNFALKKVVWKNAQKRKAEVVTLTQEMENCIPDTYRDSAADARELGQLLDAFLRTLTPDNQMVFLRRYWYVDTIAEIAARYGISESAVQMRLNRTKQKLSAYLAKEGIRV